LKPFNRITTGKHTRQNVRKKVLQMYPGVEPPPEPTTEGPQNAQITSFMQSKPSKWTKEGLLEHIVELVVVEDKV
jgi:hypothetical protein